MDLATMAIIQAASARAIVRAIGMLADALPVSEHRTVRPFEMKDFEKIIEDEGIGHNQVMTAVGW